jgi:hypothetical protein
MTLLSSDVVAYKLWQTPSYIHGVVAVQWPNGSWTAYIGHTATVYVDQEPSARDAVQVLRGSSELNEADARHQFPSMTGEYRAFGAGMLDKVAQSG